jgi:hypothetical protein
MKRRLLAGVVSTLLVSSGTFMAGCGSGGGDSGGPATFTAVYSEVLKPSCGSNNPTCHMSTDAIFLSQLDFSSQAIAYRSLYDVPAMGEFCAIPDSDSGAVPVRVVPGDPQASLLYTKVADATPPCGAAMPKPIPPATTAAPLSHAQISLIADWIDAGALNN